MTSKGETMKRSGAVLIILGGAIGLIESIILILGASLGIRIGTDFSVLSFVMGLGGLMFSVALVLLGAYVLKTSARRYGMLALVCSAVAVMLAMWIFVTILIFEVHPGQDAFSSPAHGILWSSGWYIGIFLVLGIVGGVLAMFGTAPLDSSHDKVTPAVDT